MEKKPIETPTAEALYEIVKSDMADEYNVRGLYRNTKVQSYSNVVRPPTYEGGVHAKEFQVAEDGITEVPTVRLDSVASQANRMEAPIFDSILENELGIHMPIIETDMGSKFVGRDGYKSTYEFASRLYAGELRDSVDDNGVPFFESEIGKKLIESTPRDATALFIYTPETIVFGTWDGCTRRAMSPKFTRVITSQIDGINFRPRTGTSSKLDAELDNETMIYKHKDPSSVCMYAICIEDAEMKDGLPVPYKNPKKSGDDGDPGRPSQVNLGNMPPTAKEAAGGVTIAYGVQSTFIDYSGIRALRFPLNGKRTKECDNAIRTVLALYALWGAAKAEKAMNLRAGCSLMYINRPYWETFQHNGDQASMRYFVTETAARNALVIANKKLVAEYPELTWENSKIRLHVNKQLAKGITDKASRKPTDEKLQRPNQKSKKPKTAETKV